MNVLLIVVIIILALNAFAGLQRGLIKTLFSIFSLIIALLLTVFISPSISSRLQNSEKVMNYFTEKVDEILNLEENLKEVGSKAADQLKVIDELPLPKSIKSSLIKNNNKQIYNALDVTNFADYLTRSIACFILSAVVFLICFIIILVVLKILCFTLDIISKLPILNEINKLAGFALGLLQGLIILWIGCIILTAFGSTEWGQSAFSMIKESKLLEFIYNNNLILKNITNLSKLL